MLTGSYSIVTDPFVEPCITFWGKWNWYLAQHSVAREEQKTKLNSLEPQSLACRIIEGIIVDVVTNFMLHRDNVPFT